MTERIVNVERVEDLISVFGSLDENSLSEAIAVLDSLSEGSRLVGIISHVDSLKTRISRKILVAKLPSGGSQARIVTDDL